MRKHYSTNIALTLDTQTMQDAGYDTTNTLDEEVRRDLKHMLFRGVIALMDAGRASENDVVLAQALFAHEEQTGLKLPRPKGLVPGPALETLIEMAHRESSESLLVALRRHEIGLVLAHKDPDSPVAKLIDTVSSESLGEWEPRDAWSLVHLLDGVFDEALSNHF